MNKSNIITFIRLLLGPIFVVFFYSNPLWCLVVSLIIALLIELTDLIDGIIARKYRNITEFGKLFDPFADSLSRFTVFIAFFGKGLAPIWMILIIFYRDSTVAFMRALAANRNIIISARKSGKNKALSQALGINLIIILRILGKLFPTIPAEWVSWCSWAIMLAITIVTAYSWYDYVRSALPVLRSYEK